MSLAGASLGALMSAVLPAQPRENTPSPITVSGQPPDSSLAAQLKLLSSQLERNLELREQSRSHQPSRSVAIADGAEVESLATSILSRIRESREAISKTSAHHEEASPTVARPKELEGLSLWDALDKLTTSEDLYLALVWLGYDEVAQRFGPPSKIQGVDGHTIKWVYDEPEEGAVLVIDFIDGHAVKFWR